MTQVSSREVTEINQFFSQPENSVEHLEPVLKHMTERTTVLTRLMHKENTSLGKFFENYDASASRSSKASDATAKETHPEKPPANESLSFQF